MELKLQRLQLKQLEDIFTLLKNLIKINFVHKKFISGRTIAAIFASGSKNTEGFGPKVPGFDHINFRDIKPRFPNLK